MSTSPRRTRPTRPTRRMPPNITMASTGPTAEDRSREYVYIRHDLIRILLWGGGLILAMVLIYFLGLV